MRVKEMNKEQYVLKIQLLHSKPAIWRRIVVPDYITLDRLHDVFQIVMGWADYHLAEFEIDGKRYGEPMDEDDWSDEESTLNSGLFRLGSLVKRKGATFQYLYDFGDGWEHQITLEDKTAFDPRQQPELACIDGARACPPEDVGGVPGYEEFCNAISDPTNPQHADLLEWIGADFDPTHFDAGLCNDDLMRYQRWSRDRILPWEEFIEQNYH